MASDRELGKKFVVILSIGPALIVDSDQRARIEQYLDYRYHKVFYVFGKLDNECQERRHAILLHHVVRISPYSEPAPDTEPVGYATVEKPSSEKPPFEVSEY